MRQRCALVLLLAGLSVSQARAGQPALETVTGIVTDSARATVASATVTLWAVVRDPLSNRSADNRNEVLPETEAVAALSECPPALRRDVHQALATGRKHVVAGTATSDSSGRYRISVEPEFAHVGGFALVAQIGSLAACRTVLHFRDEGPIVEEDVELVRFPRIRFHVTAQGSPVAGATVTARQLFSLGFRCGNCEAAFWRPSKEWRLSEPRLPQDCIESQHHLTFSKTTDDQGIAEFDVSPGRDESERFVFGFTVARDGLAEMRIFREPDAPADETLEVALVQEACVSGVVLGTGGEPIASAEVTAYEEERSFPKKRYESRGLLRAASATTGSTGLFTLPSLARGRRYTIFVRSPSGEAQDAEVEVEAPDSSVMVRLDRAWKVVANVSLPQGDAVREAMRRHAAYLGGVDVGLELERRSASGIWSDVAFAWFGIPGDGATFPPAVFPRLLAGEYRLRVHGDVFARSATKPFRVGEHETASVDLTLEVGRTVTGKVVDVHGKPVNAWVALFVEGVEQYSESPGSDDGSFSLSNVPHQEVEVEISKNELRARRRKVPVDTSDLGTIVLERD